MTSWLKSVGNAVGLTKGEDVPWSCSWPNEDVTDTRKCMKLLDKHHAEFQELLNMKDWTMLPDVKDPDPSGDMKLFSRPSIGSFNFVKTQFSMKGTKASALPQLIFNPKLEVRQSFAADCVAVEVIDEPTMMSALTRTQYWAPPPAAHRDFVFLVGTREHDDGSYDIWGCSVRHDGVPEKGGMVVRGTSLWGWHCIPVGDDCLATYVNCLDTRGWTPTFVMSWLKTLCINEISAARAVAMGKKANPQRTGLSADQQQTLEKEKTSK